MSSHGCNHDICFISNMRCPIGHGDAECPLVSTREFFVSQTRMGRISGESFKLPPEFYPDFLREAVQSFQNRLGENDVNRQSASGPLSQT